MYFKVVTLKDFQGHKKSTFDLGNNFTCIIGANNQGKSSVVRALMFLYFDLWDKSFVRDGAEFAEVEVIRDDGMSIIRRKGVSINELVIKKDGK